MRAHKEENAWERKLKIQTIGRDETSADNHHHPYEPTPYAVLERLADSGYIIRENCVVDYGCGKGRVGFFLNHQIGCKTVGVEYDPHIYEQARRNAESYGGNGLTKIYCCPAEEYQVKGADRFYFFNPFTTEILEAVLNKIVQSYYEFPREIYLFFYYPDDKYVSTLMAGEFSDILSFEDEIDCRDLFPGEDYRERILIFGIHN